MNLNVNNVAENNIKQQNNLNSNTLIKTDETNCSLNTDNQNYINKSVLQNSDDFLNLKHRNLRNQKILLKIQRWSSESNFLLNKHVNNKLICNPNNFLINLQKKVDFLEKQLCIAWQDIYEKEQKCSALVNLQNKVDNEIQELTGALFEEAYKMVHTAEEKALNSEKLLTEARLKVDMLENEVFGLKKIVNDTKMINSNSFQHIPVSKSAIIMRFFNNSFSNKSEEINSITNKNNLKTLSKITPKPISHKLLNVSSNTPAPENNFNTNEIDPIFYNEFVEWHTNNLAFDETCLFLKRILHEDIEPCLRFENAELSSEILTAIKKNILEMELIISDKNANNKSYIIKNQECALMKVKKTCLYRLKIAPDAKWYFISLMARNRIATVCDFFTYIRYLYQGLIKPGINDSYWFIVNLRKNMTLAKLGLHFVLKINENTTFA